MRHRTPGKSTIRRLSAAAAVVSVVAACIGGVPSATPSGSERPGQSAVASSPAAGAGSAQPSRSPRPTLSPAEAARLDLQELVRAMESIHPDLFHDMTREEWQAAIARLDTQIATLAQDPDRLTVEFMRLVALPSARGGDGHMTALPIPDTAPPVFPLAWYMFADGLWVTGSLEPAYESLIGTRVVAINGRPIADVLELVEPLVGRDNRYTPDIFYPRYLLMPEVLAGVGVIDRPGPTAFTVAEPSGRRRTVEVGLVPWDSYVTWGGHERWRRVQPRRDMLWTRRIDDVFWWTTIDGTGTVYAQLNQVLSPSDEDLNTFRAAARRRDVRRVVLDLRNNPGGEEGSLARVLEVFRDPAINRRGRLFVLTSHGTFSAASIFAVRLDLRTNATFAGEPMGGGVNFYADGRVVGLRRLPMPLQFQVATHTWTNAPGDQRMTIQPEIPAPITGTDYFAGRDRALEAVGAIKPDS